MRHLSYDALRTTPASNSSVWNRCHSPSESACFACITGSQWSRCTHSHTNLVIHVLVLHWLYAYIAGRWHLSLSRTKQTTAWSVMAATQSRL